MTGKFIKGALVEFMPTFLVPLPNVILFQYNPEEMTHAWTQADASSKAGPTISDPLAVRNVPGESFSFTIKIDSNDTIADGSAVTAELANLSGVYSRLAALEMLLYPANAFGGGLLGSVSINASASIGSNGIDIGLSASATGQVKRAVPQSQVPTVLFVWGPGRILPVRVTNLSITEKLYDSILNPIHAEAQLSLKVLTLEELSAVSSKDPLKAIAKGANVYSQGLRQALALANLANATESIIGMLPI
jgi:hypothetical protein